jgi:hypothetical protein
VPISIPKSLVVALPPILSPSSKTFVELTLVRDGDGDGDGADLDGGVDGDAGGGWRILLKVILAVFPPTIFSGASR